MRQSLFAVLTLSVALPLSAFAADSYTIDPAQYLHLIPASADPGFSTMQGRFDRSSGSITDCARRILAGNISIKVALDPSTGFAKRDDHLRSPDFFNTAEFPAISYKSTRSTSRTNADQRGGQPEHGGRQQAGDSEQRCIQMRHQPDEQEGRMRCCRQRSDGNVPLRHQIRPAGNR